MGRIRRTALLFVSAVATAQQPDGRDYDEGLRHFREGRPAEARAALERAVTENKNHAAAWKALGVVLASQGDYPAAEPAFARACALDPRLPDACFYHGRALYLLNRFTEALTVLSRLSTDARRFRIQALCLDALGRWKDAEAAYRKAIDSDPGGEDPRLDYAAALVRQGRPADALPFLQLSIESGRQPARAHLELGRAFLQLERLSEARPNLERAVQLAPASSQAHLLLGRLYARLGLTADAARHLDLGAAAAR